MDDHERDPTGALYRLGATGDLDCVERGVCITNGPCTSPDAQTFYHTDTVNRTIHAYDLHDDGSLSAKRVFFRFVSDAGYPDGTVVDSEGCLWVSMWGGWKLVRLSPHGERIGELAFPCANVTKATFGGHDLRTLYVTTARKGLTAGQLTEQPLAGALFEVEVPVSGLPPSKVDSSGWKA
jgi:sugar lactone lactonase YvrE